MSDILDEMERLASDLVVERDDQAKALALHQRARHVGVDASLALLELARLIGEAGEPSETLTAALSIEMADDRSAAGVLTIICFSAIRVNHIARQDATLTRSQVATAAARAYDLLGTSGPSVMAWLVGLVGVTVRHLSSDAASRVPVVRVETGISLPSSLVAWDLYGNPSRGREIVERNRTGSAMLMPVAFEALAT